MFTLTQVCKEFPPIRASEVTSSVTGSNRRSRGKEQTLAHGFSPQSWQLRSIRPFEARSRLKLRDRGRDVRPWMNGHQTARADIHPNPAGFEELMELLSHISACVGGLSSPFYLPSVRLQRIDTHLQSVDACKITRTCSPGPSSDSCCQKTGIIVNATHAGEDGEVQHSHNFRVYYTLFYLESADQHAYDSVLVTPKKTLALTVRVMSASS